MGSMRPALARGQKYLAAARPSNRRHALALGLLNLSVAVGALLALANGDSPTPLRIAALLATPLFTWFAVVAFVQRRRTS